MLHKRHTRSAVGKTMNANREIVICGRCAVWIASLKLIVLNFLEQTKNAAIQTVSAFPCFVRKAFAKLNALSSQIQKTSA